MDRSQWYCQTKLKTKKKTTDSKRKPDWKKRKKKTIEKKKTKRKKMRVRKTGSRERKMNWLVDYSLYRSIKRRQPQSQAR